MGFPNRSVLAIDKGGMILVLGYRDSSVFDAIQGRQECFPNGQGGRPKVWGKHTKRDDIPSAR